ncbi:MAG: DNA cytosine methyltransferase [Candidatus Nealsonbacteria bacterium]|nr:MAG: DNA cytosine methyltransferase [Candidatus Nealsonbacteria bacterium]
MGKILVACEESQVVTSELRRLGHEAYSCDTEPCSGGHPEWHLQQDVIPLLDEHWDMILAFPPCTHLASSGARWFKEKRKDGRQQQAINFFMHFAKCSCTRVAIENPVGIMSTMWRKPDQIIQPWMFGHPETKATCLWLKNLPKLQPTHIVAGREHRIWKLPPSKDRAKIRSKTFPGIAKAMAIQWSSLAKEGL